MQSKFKFKAGDLVKVGETGSSTFFPSDPYTPWVPDGKLGIVLGYDKHGRVKLIIEGIREELWEKTLEKVNKWTVTGKREDVFIPWLNAKNRMTWHIGNQNKTPNVCVLKPETHVWEKALCGEEVWYPKENAKTHSEMNSEDYVCKRCKKIGSRNND